jgi:hypothetical protein
MLQREKKGPKDGVQSAKNLPTWKIGLQYSARNWLSNNKDKKKANALHM